MIDFEQAAAFIAALTGSNGWTTPMTFQTLDDRGADHGLTRIRHGPLRRHADVLAGLNERGAGVFVAVNETDGRGRKAENIVAVRACFIDCDGPRRGKITLPPSIVVRTPKGGHVYWRVVPGEDSKRFRAVQQRLAAYFGSDPVVCDLPRLMRLPGTVHNKEAPMPVQILRLHPERRYSFDEIVSAHPARTAMRPDAGARWSRPRDFGAWAAQCSASAGRRNTTAFAIAAEGFGEGHPFSEVAAVVEAYCRRAGIESEAPAVVASAHAHVERRKKGL